MPGFVLLYNIGAVVSIQTAVKALKEKYQVRASRESITGKLASPIGGVYSLSRV